MNKDTDVLIKLIYDSYNSSHHLGSLGELLYMQIDDILKEKEQNTNKEIKDEKIINKIKELKIEEDNKNLIWIDYYSWNNLPKNFRDLLVNLCDPLFWGGVFFKYSDWENNHKILCKNLDITGNLYLLKEIKQNYVLVWLSSFQDIQYDSLHDFKFREIKNKFIIRTIKIYGISKLGDIYIKEFRGDNNEQV